MSPATEVLSVLQHATTISYLQKGRGSLKLPVVDQDMSARQFYTSLLSGFSTDLLPEAALGGATESPYSILTHLPRSCQIS